MLLRLYIRNRADHESIKGRKANATGLGLVLWASVQFSSIKGKVAKELSVPHSIAIGYLKQIGKVNKLHKWVPHELTENLKIVFLKCLLLLFCATTMNYFSIRL